MIFLCVYIAYLMILTPSVPSGPPHTPPNPVPLPSNDLFYFAAFSLYAPMS